MHIYVCCYENKKTNSVGVGVTVKVHVDGGEEEFMIVGAPEANPIDKKISHESPLGKALLGKKVGDHVDVEAPMGNLTYTVLSIK
jgi:transcription elongation factor GreA